MWYTHSTRAGDDGYARCDGNLEQVEGWYLEQRAGDDGVLQEGDGGSSDCEC